MELNSTTGKEFRLDVGPFLKLNNPTGKEFNVYVGPILKLNSTTGKEFRVDFIPFLELNSTTDKEFRVNLGSHIGQRRPSRVLGARFRVIFFLIAQAEGCHACGERCLDLAIAKLSAQAWHWPSLLLGASAGRTSPSRQV